MISLMRLYVNRKFAKKKWCFRDKLAKIII